MAGKQVVHLRPVKGDACSHVRQDRLNIKPLLRSLVHAQISQITLPDHLHRVLQGSHEVAAIARLQNLFEVPGFKINQFGAATLAKTHSKVAAEGQQTSHSPPPPWLGSCSTLRVCALTHTHLEVVGPLQVAHPLVGLPLRARTSHTTEVTELGSAKQSQWCNLENINAT
jgi:hypothetical protein